LHRNYSIGKKEQKSSCPLLQSGASLYQKLIDQQRSSISFYPDPNPTKDQKTNIRSMPLPAIMTKNRLTNILPMP